MMPPLLVIASIRHMQVGLTDLPRNRGPGWSRTPRLCPVESPVPPQPPSGYLDPGRSIRAAGRPGRRLGATLLEGETVADVSRRVLDARQPELDALEPAVDRRTGENTANSIAAALASVPPEHASLAVDVLATHPSEWMRALAAVIWAQRPDLPEEIRARPRRFTARSCLSRTES